MAGSGGGAGEPCEYDGRRTTGDTAAHSGLFNVPVSTTPHEHGPQGLKLHVAHERPVGCVGRLKPASLMLGDARASPGIDDGAASFHAQCEKRNLRFVHEHKKNGEW